MIDDFTTILEAADRGEPNASERLLPLVYEQLKGMAAKALAAESPGQTLSPTALVHEAYLRLSDGDDQAVWAGRRHFLAAAAQAMRRILIESARKKAGRRSKVGSAVDLDSGLIPAPDRPEELLALDEALSELAVHDPLAAKLVELRFFAGLTQQEAAVALQLSLRTAERTWTLAKAWLYQRIQGG
jgi:RNA polymerase sigma factor (TIGR02999 family)